MDVMTKQSRKIYDMVFIGVFTVLIAICSWIAIPAAIPFTLQTMAVFAAVGILGGRRGTISVLLYIIMGAIGLPVFAGFTGGAGILLGNSGGYIVGFLGSALVMWGMEKMFGQSRMVLALSMLAGLFVCYAFGTAWYLFAYTKRTGTAGLAAVLGWCVIPFIVPDLIKIAAALVLTERLRRFVK